MKSTSPASSPRDLRLLRYCATGLGAAAVTGAVTQADAAIVFVNYNNQVVLDTTPADSTFTLFSFDLDGNGTIDFRLGQRTGDTNGGGAIVLAPTGGTLGVIGISSSGYNYAGRLGGGVNVGPGAGFLNLTGSGFGARASLASGNGFPNSQWASPSPSTGYLGLRFTGVGGVTQYAWLQLTVDGNTNPGARKITLIGAAFENTGAAIQTGAVPEPTTTSLGLLALGAFGLMAHRKRTAARRAAAQAAA